jgi:hypothetical protein
MSIGRTTHSSTLSGGPARRAEAVVHYGKSVLAAVTGWLASARYHICAVATWLLLMPRFRGNGVPVLNDDVAVSSEDGS